jgi:large subunit ribosomal protein L17
MRHRKGFNQLSRKNAHRKAMFANMASSLILHKRIQTTTAKAKALRTYVEPLITKSKNDSTHSRRMVFRYLKDKEAVSELFREVSPKIADRPGGYTRILKTGNRLGDNAEMCIIELVDFNENMLAGAEETKTKTRRRRRFGKKKPSETTVEKAADVTSPEQLDEETEQPVPEKEEPAAEVEESMTSEQSETTAAEPEEKTTTDQPAEENPGDNDQEEPKEKEEK